MPLLREDLTEAEARFHIAEQARFMAQRAWQEADAATGFEASVALDAAERDLRLARDRMEILRRGLADLELEPRDEKAWGSH
jgi:hypothetical protein